MPAVRQTESRIPYNDPQRLGEVGTLTEPAGVTPPDCYLISYLTSPIPVGSTNTYVVFVTGETLGGQVASYEWVVEEEIEPDNRQTVPVEAVEDHPAVLEYRPRSVVPVDVRVHIKDDAGDVLRTLHLRQEVRPQYQALERLLQSADVEIDGVAVPGRVAVGLTPQTSREVINDLFGYIRDAFEAADNESKVPLRLLAAVVWLQAHRVPKEETPEHDLALGNRFRNTEMEAVGAKLNGEGRWAAGTKLHNAIGVAQISPATAAMILKPPGSSETTYTDPLILPHDPDEREATRESIRDNYATKTDADAKTDLYNLLRFPKSNIRICFELLNYLKNRPERYPAVTTADFFDDDDALAIIATEFEIGATASTVTQAEPNAFGRAALKVLGSPLFALGFGGEIALRVEGEVIDEMDATASMAGARVDAWVTTLRVDHDGLPCFRSIDAIAAPDPEKVPLALGEVLPVLEIRRTPPGFSDDDLVKVRKTSSALDLNEGWVVIRSAGNRYGTLLSHRIDSVATVDEDGRFTFDMPAPQPVFIRVVKEPQGERGYFDGELGQVTAGLPPGWILPPASGLVIRQTPARYMVRESDLVGLLADWLNYSYAHNLVPDYPDDYFLAEMTPDIREYWVAMEPNPDPPPDEIPVVPEQIEYADHQIACNTFVEALVVEGWHRAYPDDFSWVIEQHALAMFQENEWLPGWNVDIDAFSPAWVYAERLLEVKENPGVGDQFVVSIGGVDVEVTSGATAVETTTNIAAAIRANPGAAALVDVSRGATYRTFVAIRPAAENADPSSSLVIGVASGSGQFELTPARDNNIFPAVRLDLEDGARPPAWTVIQGWRTWNPVENPEKPGTATGFRGHNLILVGTDPGSGKVLVLEANFSDNIDGVGFRGMGGGDESGNIEQNRVGQGPATPNVDRHWTEKVSWDWRKLRAEYDALEDGGNPMGVARLKVYDCRWAGPYLYETEL